LIRLAWFCSSDHGFARFSAAIEPKLDPSFLESETGGASMDFESSAL